MKLLSLLQNQPLPGLLVLSHWKHVQHVRIKNPQRQWQLLRPAGYVKAALLQHAVTPARIWAQCATWDSMWKCKCAVCRVSRVTLGWDSLPAQRHDVPGGKPFCLRLHTRVQLDAVVHPRVTDDESVSPAMERGKGKQSSCKEIPNEQIRTQFISAWCSSWSCKELTICLSAGRGKLKCLLSSALILINFHWKASQCCHQDINYVTHYLYLFLKSLWILSFFFKTLLREVTHNQIMYVFL